MKTNLYVVYDLDKKDYQCPFVANSDADALICFYAQTHNPVDNLRLETGYRPYSYRLYCLGVLNPYEVSRIDFTTPARLVAVSNFVVEDEDE